MAPPLLTIAIPTFQRAKQLKSRLLELKPQLSNQVTLQVYENGQTAEVSSVMAPYLSESIQFLPAAKNGGFLRNYLRCIEGGNSEWVWIIGDDDAVKQNAIEMALCAIENTSADAISYRAFSQTNASPVVVSTIEEFFTHTTFSESLFISSTIWKRSVLESGVIRFLDCGYSMSSHLVVLLERLASGDIQIDVRDERLIVPTITDHRWSRMEYIRRSPTLLDFISNSGTSVVAARALMATTWLWASIDSLKEVTTYEDYARWRKSFLIGATVLRFHSPVSHRETRFLWKDLLRVVIGKPPSRPASFLSTLPAKLGYRFFEAMKSRIIT